MISLGHCTAIGYTDNIRDVIPIIPRLAILCYFSTNFGLHLCHFLLTGGLVWIIQYAFPFPVVELPPMTLVRKYISRRCKWEVKTLSYYAERPLTSTNRMRRSLPSATIPLGNFKNPF